VVPLMSVLESLDDSLIEAAYRTFNTPEG
jgi:ABC-type spermidine/putrescine transport system permease subunit I